MILARGASGRGQDVCFCASKLAVTKVSKRRMMSTLVHHSMCTAHPSKEMADGGDQEGTLRCRAIFPFAPFDGILRPIMDRKLNVTLCAMAIAVSAAACGEASVPFNPAQTPHGRYRTPPRS